MRGQERPGKPEGAILISGPAWIGGEKPRRFGRDRQGSGSGAEARHWPRAGGVPPAGPRVRAASQQGRPERKSGRVRPVLVFRPPASRKGCVQSGAATETFATTHGSVVLAAGGANTPAARQAWEQLARTYWRPLYGHAQERARESFAVGVYVHYASLAHCCIKKSRDQCWSDGSSCDFTNRCTSRRACSQSCC